MNPQLETIQLMRHLLDHIEEAIESNGEDDLPVLMTSVGQLAHEAIGLNSAMLNGFLAATMDQTRLLSLILADMREAEPHDDQPEVA